MYPRCKSLGLIEALTGEQMAGRVLFYPRCKSLGLIEAPFKIDLICGMRFLSEV